jgi:hypothetical protein
VELETDAKETESKCDNGLQDTRESWEETDAKASVINVKSSSRTVAGKD